MQTKTIICPICKSTLNVNNSKNEHVKIIKCPVCASQLRVKFEMEETADDDSDTDYSSFNTDKTIIPDKLMFSKAYLVFEGTRYELSEGRNIVGRKAKSSTADVQIDSGDLYMSRSNSVINVRKTNMGLVVSVANCENKNPILVGKVKLQDNDEFALKNGDTITMGRTILKLLLE